MVYAQAKLGKYTLMYNPFEFQRFFEREAASLKIPGGYIIQDLGENPEIFRFKAWLVGSAAKNQLGQILNELKREDIVYFNSDVTGECWVKIKDFSLSEELGSIDNNYVYQYLIELLNLGYKNEFSRCTIFTYNQIVNDFNIEGKIVVPLPVGAYNATEVADFNRQSVEGNIPCIDSPFATTIAYEVSEDNIDKARLQSSIAGREVSFNNGLIKLATRHDETIDLGDLELYLFNGSNWSYIGNLSFDIKAKDNDYDGFNNATPSVYAVIKKYYGRVKLLYPSSLNKNYELGVLIEFWFGKPFIKVTPFHPGPSNLIMEKIRFTIKFNSDFNSRYYTRLGNVLDAQADTYGEKIDDASNDMYGYVYCHDQNPIGNNTIEAGFMLAKKATNYIANDIGNVWSNLKIEYSNLQVKRGENYPSIWVFLQKQGVMGGISPADLIKEALCEVSFFMSIKKVV
jgi:hypothetical protein